MKQYTIINGPSHGETFEIDTTFHSTPLYFNRREAPPIQADITADVRFIVAYLVRKYLLRDDFAYYMGETPYYPSVVLEDYPHNEKHPLDNITIV